MQVSHHTSKSENKKTEENQEYQSTKHWFAILLPQVVDQLSSNEEEDRSHSGNIIMLIHILYSASKDSLW